MSASRVARALMLVGAALIAGCGGAKPDGGLVHPIRGAPGPAAGGEKPRYGRYYALWWTAHSELSNQIPRGMGRSESDNLFQAAIANLNATKAFLNPDQKKVVESFAAEYIRLQGLVVPAKPNRHVTSGLDRLKTRIMKTISPKRVSAAAEEGP